MKRFPAIVVAAATAASLALAPAAAQQTPPSSPTDPEAAAVSFWIPAFAGMSGGYISRLGLAAHPLGFKRRLD